MYEDNNGLFRTHCGQFYIGSNTVEDQFKAGVNWNDSPATAQLKVEEDRRRRGLDPYTGQPPLKPVPLYGPSYGSPAPLIDETPSELKRGLVKWLVKVPLALGTLALLVVAAGPTIKSAWLESSTRASLVEYAVDKAYEGQPLSSPSGSLMGSSGMKGAIAPSSAAGLMSAKQLALEMDPPSPGARQLHSVKVIQAAAWSCVATPSCLAELKAAGASETQARYLGAIHLRDRAFNQRDEQAAADLCQWRARLIGAKIRPLERDREMCLSLAQRFPGSAKMALAVTASGSPWLTLARWASLEM